MTTGIKLVFFGSLVIVPTEDERETRCLGFKLLQMVGSSHMSFCLKDLTSGFPFSSVRIGYLFFDLSSTMLT